MRSFHLAATCLCLLACGSSFLNAEPPIPPTAEQAAQTLTIADAAKPSHWKGALPGTLTSADAPQTVRWIPTKNRSLALPQAPKDWTGPWNTLEFWIHSAKPAKTRFLIYIGSEDDSQPGMDYYSISVTLDFQGWRRCSYPIKDFNAVRAPAGMHKIDRVSFTTTGWNITASPDTDLHLGSVRLVYEKPVTGPLTTDQQLFDALNLELPELKDVKEAVAANDLHLAKKRLVHYLKTREKEQTRWFTDWRRAGTPEVRNEKYFNKTAENACKNLLESCNVPMQFGERIDWTANPTKLQYAEWTWQLSRHPFWVALARAFWFTGNEKYAKTYVRQIRSWIIDNPLPNNPANGTGSRWRTLETGIRMGSTWPEAFFTFLNSKALDDDSVIMILKSFYEHALHVRDFNMSNNWLCTEMNGLYHVGALFPEFKQADEWREYAAKRLYDEMRNQVFPDGAQIELAPGYHNVSLQDFIATYRIAQRNGYQLPGDYIARLEGMYQTFLNYCTPNRTSPALNDSTWISLVKPLQQGHSLFPQRTDFLYVATYGQKGEAPRLLSSFMPYAGWYSLRSDWTRNALFCNFEVGPFGDGHQHEDKLTFELYAYGSRLLTEGGVYPYDRSQWRRYIVTAPSHNVIRVDGQDQHRRRSDNRYNIVTKPLTNRFLTNDVYDFAEGQYNEGFGNEKSPVNVTHTRSLLFVRNDYWLVFDVMTPPDQLPHTYESWFHFDTDKTTRPQHLANAVVTNNEHLPNLLIAPLNPAGQELNVICGQEEPYVQGWVPARNRHYDMRAVATPTYIRKATGQVMSAYLFLPLKPDAPNPVTAIDSQGDNTFVISFADGRRDTITASPRADGYLQTLTLIRQTADGNVSSHSVIQQ